MIQLVLIAFLQIVKVPMLVLNRNGGRQCGRWTLVLVVLHVGNKRVVDRKRDKDEKMDSGSRRYSVMIGILEMRMHALCVT